MRRALLLTLSLALAACTIHVTPSPQSPAISSMPADVLYAGVARADITPPPGLSMFGHGPEGRVAVGTLLRLYCEAFVFERGDEAIALVPCDLAAISIELQRAVADKVIRTSARLGADRIVMMATHTHAGPAHYFGARQYSSTFSSRAPGFDPKVLDFLAERIASAIVVAYRSKVVAHVGWSVKTGAGLGLVHNRSFSPFAANERLPPCLTARLCPTCIDAPASGIQGSSCDAEFRQFYRQNREILGCASLGDVSGRGPVELAADMNLSVLAVEEVLPGGTRPLGGFAVFGVHNTGISNRNDVYHSDIFGFAQRQAEQKIGEGDEGGSRRVLIGIANGIEGDVSPAVGTQSIAEARRVGMLLGDRIGEAFNEARERATGADDTIARVYRELVLPSAVAEEPSAFYRDNQPPACSGLRWEGPPYAPPTNERLCPTPEVGVAAAGGAEDGPTRLRIFPAMNEGTISPVNRGCQGRKLPVIGPTGEFTCDGLDLPNVAPVTLVRIGSATIVATPFELTTVAGIRMRDRLTLFTQKHEPAVKNIVMVGLANSYLQYLATPSEYQLQNYEGASTLYGLHTARFINNHLICLADSLYGSRNDGACRMGQPFDINTVHPVRYSPIEASRMPTNDEPPSEHVQLEDPDPIYSTTDLWPSWTVHFHGVRPGDAMLRERFMVRVVDAESGVVLDDDTGTGFMVRYDPAARDKEGWLARWTPRGTHCGKMARFIVETTSVVTSKPFEIRCPTNQTEKRDVESVVPPSPPALIQTDGGAP